MGENLPHAELFGGNIIGENEIRCTQQHMYKQVQGTAISEDSIEGRNTTHNYIDNRAELLEKQTTYNAAHVEEIREYQATYKAANAATLHAKNTCPCGGCFTTTNKAVHLKTAKHAAWLAAAAV